LRSWEWTEPGIAGAIGRLRHLLQKVSAEWIIGAADRTIRLAHELRHDVQVTDRREEFREPAEVPADAAALRDNVEPAAARAVFSGTSLSRCEEDRPGCVTFDANRLVDEGCVLGCRTQSLVSIFTSGRTMLFVFQSVRMIGAAGRMALTLPSAPPAPPAARR
jgi:hypothetical protein